MYLDARTVIMSDRRSSDELLRCAREELRPVEHRLQRIQLRVGACGGQQQCWLLAWSERGQTFSIEKAAASALEAARLAIGSLRRALDRPMSGTLSGVQRGDSGAPSSSSQASPLSVEPSSVAVRATRTARGGPLLLALHELDATAPHVEWARVLASALDAPLEVCRALAGVGATARLEPGAQWLSATRLLLAEGRRTRAWCSGAVPEAELVERVLPGGDGYGAELGRLARQRQASWLVVPADEATRGSTVTALARSAACPVLVARPAQARCTLLIASDDESPSHGMLESAARLAGALHAPVLAFRNVAAPSSSRFVSRAGGLLGSWARLQAREALAHPEYRLPDLEVLLGHGRNPVEAILQQARREGADMLIVAAGPAGAAEPCAADEVAAAVVDQALRSVLVVPSAPAA